MSARRVALQVRANGSNTPRGRLIFAVFSSDVLDDEQKTRKVGNLLTNMRRAGIIRNTGSRRAPKWELV